MSGSKMERVAARERMCRWRDLVVTGLVLAGMMFGATAIL